MPFKGLCAAAVVVLAFLPMAVGAAPPAYDLTIAEERTPRSVPQFGEAEVSVTIRNDGSIPWNTEEFRVAYHWLTAEGEPVVWDGTRTPLPHDVAPGETIRVKARLTAPTRSGDFLLQWDVVQESVTWVSQADPTPAPLLRVTVAPRAPSHAFTIVAAPRIGVITAGKSRTVPLRVRNDGTASWSARSGINLSYHWHHGDEGKRRFEGARTALPRDLRRGEVADAEVQLQAPSRAGIYRLQWDVVEEGRRWFNEADPTPAPPRVVVVFPAIPFGAFAFLIALLALVAVVAAPKHPRLAATASIADLVVLAVALFAKQDAVLRAAGVTYIDGARMVALSAVAAAVLAVSFFPPRFRAWVALGVNALATAIIATDVVHLRFFRDVTSVVRLRAVGQLPQLAESIGALVDPIDLWLVADLLPAAVIAFLLRKVTTERRARVSLALVAAAFLLPGVLMLWRVNQAKEGKFVQVFNKIFLIQEMGVLNYHAWDLWSHLRETVLRDELTPQRRREIEEWFRETAPTRAAASDTFGIARGSNLIMIQVESMQDFVFDLEIDGQEITPNLNRWKREKALWFSSCTDQTAQGRTSDGELASQASLHPLPQGSAAFRFGSNRFRSIAKIAGEHGYTTLSAVPFDRGFWNRGVTHPAFGFKTSLFSDAFEPGPVVGWGLNDRDFLRQMTPRLKATKQPFAALLITLSNHYPYADFPPELKRLRLGSYEGTAIGNYLHSMHLFDVAFGEFVRELETAGLLDKSVIVLWGDHASGLAWDEKLATLCRRRYTQADFYFADEVPLLVRLPNGALRGERPLRCGLVDIAPTLLPLLGFDAAREPFVGRNLLGTSGDGPVVRAYGAWFYRDVFYIPRGAAFEQGICYDAKTMARIEVERCREGSVEARRQLAVSRDVIEHDLQEALR